MRITEHRLRRIIRSVILERWDDDKAAKEKEKIAERIADLYKLTVEDVKFLLDEIHVISDPVVYIPKFLRSIFPPDDKGHMIISVNVLESMGFDESHIDKLCGPYGIAGKAFRHFDYTVI